MRILTAHCIGLGSTAIALCVAMPALAAPGGDAVVISAPDDMALFALGVAGLLVGRRLARRRQRKDHRD